MIQDCVNIIYSNYGVNNISKCEEFVHIDRPDKDSQVYRDFNQLMNNKAASAMKWLAERNIEYVWNNWIDRHLYRLYIPSKELIFDFEFYPVYTDMYNYIRINYNTDIIEVLELLYPENVYETNDLQIWVVTQYAANKFLKQNNHNSIYYKNILRLAWIKDNEIIQLVIIHKNHIIANVTKKLCKVNYGTFMILRYLTEYLEFKEIYIKERLNNSYNHDKYQLWGMKIINKSNKNKIWWSSTQTKWHISQSEIDNYVPFYFTEKVTYCYSHT